MLLPSLGKEQHKVNKTIFEKSSIFQNFYINKWPYFCFNFLLIQKFVSCLFDVYCRWIFDPEENNK